MVSLLEKSRLKFEWVTHDNWDGGFDIYSMWLLTTLKTYLAYENNFELFSSEIDSATQILTKSYPDRIGRIYLGVDDNDENHIHFSAQNTLEKLNHSYALELSTKAIDRLNSNDYEGAITIASTLLEDIIKVLLDEFEISYSDDDIPQLYRKLIPLLNLSPSQHTEEIFKHILGGCFSVIQGLGAFRNKTGDAHGRGKTNYKPAKRHAQLAVNLSTTMTTYLIATFEDWKSKKTTDKLRET